MEIKAERVIEHHLLLDFKRQGETQTSKPDLKINMIKKNKPLFVVSLGGSLIAPDGGVDVDFLKQFRDLVLGEIKNGSRFIIVTGGGRTARRYIDAARRLGFLHAEDLDWLGIHGTRLNAHLIRAMFRKYANPKVVKDPLKKLFWKEPILVAGGWKPGRSSDHVAVMLATLYGAKTVLNLSNIAYLYTRDPRVFKMTEPICEISWVAFRKMVGTKWDPGANLPFDPIAARFAQKEKMKVILVDGRNIENLRLLLNGRGFEGTIIG